VRLGAGELLGAFRLWLAIQAPDFCMLNVERPALDRTAVRPLHTTSARFAAAPGLLGSDGICLVECGEEPTSLVVRCYGGRPELRSQLQAYLAEWDRLGRPFTSGLTIEAVDRKECSGEGTCATMDGDYLIERRFARFRLHPAPPSGRGRWGVGVTPTSPGFTPPNPDAQRQADVEGHIGSTHAYGYVSYSSPPIGADCTALLQAAWHHEPIESRTIRAFDWGEWLAGRLPSARSSGRGGGDAAAEVFDLMTRAEYCNGPIDHVLGVRDDLISSIRGAIADHRPVEIVLPSFPGRPVNLLRHTRTQPDLGEAAALARLWALHREVVQVHPPGLRWIIVMDGVAYAPFYGYPTPPYRQYQADLRAMAETLGVTPAFRFVDLAGLVEARRADFDELHDHVTEELTAVWDDPAYGFPNRLIEAMKLGSNTAPADAAAVQSVTFPPSIEEVSAVHRQLARAVSERARATAFSYMCFLVTMRRLDFLTAAFPAAIRGTVHPKPGQYSPRLDSSRHGIVPWHGMAVLESDGEVRVVYESEILGAPGRYRAVYQEGEYTPLFHEPRGGSG
jgi:pyoverdine/dityrosine biosynthesis protein Dit1